MCLGDRADAVRDPRASRESCQSRRASKFARRLGGEHCGLLVSHIDDAHRWLGLDRGVVKREHVCAGECEQRRDPVLAGCREREVATVSFEDLAAALAGAALSHGLSCVAGIEPRRQLRDDGKQREQQIGPCIGSLGE